MIDNQYAYELTADQLAKLDIPAIKDLINLRNDSFTYIRTDENETLTRLNDTVFSGFLLGVSLFKLKLESEVERAHVDRNVLRPFTSRQCAINFAVDDTTVTAKWYTENDPIFVQHAVYQDYALYYYPVASNTVVFEHTLTTPTLITTNTPHLGYSNPVGGGLVSLGFSCTFEEMKAFLQY